MGSGDRLFWRDAGEAIQRTGIPFEVWLGDATHIVSAREIFDPGAPGRATPLKSLLMPEERGADTRGS